MSFGFVPLAIWHPGVAQRPAARGRTSPQSTEAYSRARLPTDSIGNMDLTLTNVAVGSAWRIEIQSTGALVDAGTAASSSVPVTVPVYGSGSSLNDLRIRVRKGTAAPKYQPYETQAIAAVGSQSVYIAQVPDPIA